MNSHILLSHKSKLVIVFCSFLMLSGCKTDFEHPITRSTHGLSISMDSLEITIEIVDESIIHVKKRLLGTEESKIPDYVTVLEPQNVACDVTQTKDQIIISTEAITVLVNSDGTIQYEDNEGKSLLDESNELTYIKPDTSNGNVVSQAFLVGDEALYGLGQHQSGIMNWKNVPMRLEQFNQEAAIPFLVSTNNYGLYWHNYSRTDFNECQFEIEFPEKEEKVTTQVKESQDLDIENVIKSKADINKEKNIRETTFTPQETGMYTFFVESDKKVRMRGEILLKIDEDTVISYSTVWVPTCYSGLQYLEAGKEYNVLLQNTGAKEMMGTVHYNKPSYNKTVFSSERGGSIDYYFIHGDNPAAVISKNHKLTGTTPMFKKKAYGFWQCRERYHDQAELLENANEMRKRKIPVDMIVQDWFYWPKGTKGPEWDRSKYPDPKAMADEVHDLNMDLMVSVWPQVNNDPLLEKYNLLEFKLGEKNHNLDFFDQGVRERYYNMLSDSMFHIGINSIWLDGTEPSGKPDKEHETAVGPYKDVYNVYSLVVTKAMYEGKRKEYPNERVLNLTRSAYSGQQRYGAVTWSGDVASTWEQLEEQIPAGLNFTMAGVPYWTHDIGGFFRDSKSMNPVFDSQYTNKEFIELMARWFQFGTFSPIFRIHGYVSETEIWRYGQEFEDMARKFIDIRYKLLPYIYSEAWKVTNDGHVLMSPLAYYYPNDKETWSIKDQLFFGESIMLGFVTEYGQRSKEMYFPMGEWYNYWTKEKIVGGKRVLVDAPFNSTPMFVKAGSIIPTGPKVQYATEETNEPLQIMVFPGKDTEYVLYMDDNETNGYLNGDYSEIVISYSEENQTVEVKKGKGNYMDFETKPLNVVIELVGTDKQQTIVFNGTTNSIKL